MRTQDELIRFDAQLGFPSRAFPVIHVGGTNGKGSVTYKIAAALEASGKKVGLYTSPHISSHRERIQINQKMISEKDINRLIEKVLASVSEQLSFFELMTLIAFSYFSEERVDAAIIEVGLGGRLDATNIVRPILSVITTIDYEHTHILGQTLEEIACEKAGIIKEGVPVLIGPEAKPFSIFEHIAREKKAPLLVVREKERHYELENRSIAQHALKHLGLSEKTITHGIQRSPPCRFERVHRNVVLDVGHNPAALTRTFERFSLEFESQKPHVLAAFSSDKDAHQMVRIIEKHADYMHFTQARHERACQIGTLVKEGEPDLAKAFDLALHRACAMDAILLVCGTFFIMDEIRSRLNLAHAHD